MVSAFMPAFVGCPASPIKARYCSSGLFLLPVFQIFYTVTVFFIAFIRERFAT